MTTFIAPSARDAGRNPTPPHLFNRSCEKRQPRSCAPPLVWTHPARHPLSRWYLCHWVEWTARALCATALHPTHISWVGIGWTTIAVWLLTQTTTETHAGLWAAGAIWLAWFCDRLDGALARAQGSATTWGAWLDANFDELADLAIHAGLACATYERWGIAGWIVFAAFAGAKHLFTFGLYQEQIAWQRPTPATAPPVFDSQQRAGAGSLPDNGRNAFSHVTSRVTTPRGTSLPTQLRARCIRWLRTIYHLAGNADVRTHLLIVCVAAGLWEFALLYAAFYFNTRWMIRYLLVARRLRGEA